MVNIRSFKEEDNETLLSIERLCPQGNEECAVAVDKGPDITARYELYDNWEIRVAEEDDTTVGWIGWTVKQGPEQKYVYVAEVMVHPDYRRQGIGVKLLREAEKAAHEANVSHIYCYIYEPNKASMKLVEKLGYIQEKDVRIIAMSAYKKEHMEREYELARIDGKDLPEAVKLINGYYAGKAHFSPFTAPSFRTYVNRVLGYGLENFLVAKWKGKIVACGGFWDSSVLMEMTYTKEPIMWKIMANAYGILRHFISMPRIPAEGEFFKFHSIVDHAFEPEHALAMEEILDYCNNLMFDTKCEFFGVYTDPDDPILEIVKKFKPLYETMFLYAKTISCRLPDFSSIYVDGRDPIL
ncbi:GNAT family N-acetyltransferase [uncultured Methanolobus sp.]|uniref:GNAT family N-acetyltransferase n=1 Tax=uncultured Methanolobus sp. TaxID=218300 RepID=UPI0029C629C8|nr:GNAT family N-acetyltransferase [uncultured Methanolobus sp.]